MIIMSSRRKKAIPPDVFLRLFVSDGDILFKTELSIGGLEEKKTINFMSMVMTGMQNDEMW